MRELNFYEFVGILVPGALLLVCIGLVFEIDKGANIFLPSSLGSAVISLVVSYAVGHLIQGFGNIVESAYWKCWSGMPSDWPFTKPRRELPVRFRDLLSDFAGVKKIDTIDSWRQHVGTARSIIYAKNRAGRLETFNGNYGLFRGLAASGIFLMCLVWAGERPAIVVYPAIGGVVILALYRMHRFAIHYAREFFSSLSALVLETNANTAGRSG